ncbi:MAG: dicarboxylate/amino acid:cation symporter, partial [Xanthomonadales bacterium]|nr:dicarboxylate/amino acid:cation symporter [Xanthomonadales bacterium]
MKHGRSLTTWILVALVAGGACGFVLYYSGTDSKPWVEWFRLVTDIFLRLIKMIIAPLVFATLTVGIAKMGDTSSVGRVGIKAFAWFVGASLVSLLLGL